MRDKGWFCGLGCVVVEILQNIPTKLQPLPLSQNSYPQAFENNTHWVACVFADFLEQGFCPHNRDHHLLVLPEDCPHTPAAHHARPGAVTVPCKSGTTGCTVVAVQPQVGTISFFVLGCRCGPQCCGL